MSNLPSGALVFLPVTSGLIMHVVLPCERKPAIDALSQRVSGRTPSLWRGYQALWCATVLKPVSAV